MKLNHKEVNKFKELLKECLIDGLNIINLKIEEDNKRNWNFLLDYHKGFPTLSYLENGLPSFYLSDFQKRDYSKILSKDNKYLEIPSWKNYHEFFRNTDFLKRYFKLFEFSRFKEGTKTEIIENFSQIYTYYFLLNFVDSYIHLNSFNFNEEIYLNYFSLYLNSIIKEKYEFDVIVPILCITFDFEEYKITDSISITKLSEREQLSRNIMKGNTISVHDNVVGAATHAFRLKFWTIDNTDSDTVGFTIYDANAFHNVIDVIDKLFATLRINTNADTGYAQILTTPNNSIRHFKADLLDMSVITDRKYPDKFENFGWSNEIREIATNELENFAFLFEKISKTNYTFAIKKLNSASIRKSDEDTILDITSALESLLTSDSKNEITYRLSIRASQLCKISQFQELSTKQVFELCKKLYNYRSAVVHGDIKRIEKTKTISIHSSIEIPMIRVAFDLLRHLLKILLENDINKVDAIDEIMLE